jgi:hypothetical protein
MNEEGIFLGHNINLLLPFNLECKHCPSIDVIHLCLVWKQVILLEVSNSKGRDLYKLSKVVIMPTRTTFKKSKPTKQKAINHA